MGTGSVSAATPTTQYELPSLGDAYAEYTRTYSHWSNQINLMGSGYVPNQLLNPEDQSLCADDPTNSQCFSQTNIALANTEYGSTIDIGKNRGFALEYGGVAGGGFLNYYDRQASESPTFGGIATAAGRVRGIWDFSNQIVARQTRVDAYEAMGVDPKGKSPEEERTAYKAAVTTAAYQEYAEGDATVVDKATLTTYIYGVVGGKGVTDEESLRAKTYATYIESVNPGYTDSPQYQKDAVNSSEEFRNYVRQKSYGAYLDVEEVVTGDAIVSATAKYKTEAEKDAAARVDAKLLTEENKSAYVKGYIIQAAIVEQLEVMYGERFDTIEIDAALTAATKAADTQIKAKKLDKANKDGYIAQYVAALRADYIKKQVAGTKRAVEMQVKSICEPTEAAIDAKMAEVKTKVKEGEAAVKERVDATIAQLDAQVDAKVVESVSLFSPFVGLDFRGAVGLGGEQVITIDTELQGGMYVVRSRDNAFYTAVTVPINIYGSQRQNEVYGNVYGSTALGQFFGLPGVMLGFEHYFWGPRGAPATNSTSTEVDSGY